MASTYADRLQGLDPSIALKAPVAVATTANITLSGEQTIDGIAVIAGDRVLVKNQASGVENGVYIAKAEEWERATDFNGERDIAQGTFVVTAQGTLNGNSMFSLSTASPVIGSTSLTFVTVNGTAAAVAIAEAAATSAAASAAAIEPYPDRVTAEAATIPAPVQRISVIHDGNIYDYVLDPGGNALTTGDGKDWSPAGLKKLGHWGVSPSNSVVENAASLTLALGSGGAIYTDNIGTITTNRVNASLASDTTFVMDPGTTIKGATGLDEQVVDFSGAHTLTIVGNGGKVNTADTSHNVGTGSGTGFVFDSTLKSVHCETVWFFCASSKQTTNGDSGISGTAANVTIVNCRFSGHADAGVYQAGTANHTANGAYDGQEGKDWTVTGCRFEYCQVAMTAKRNSYGGVFSGNEVYYCDIGFTAIPADSGVTLLPSKGWTVTNNQFSKISDRAIEMRYVSLHLISNNWVLDHGYSDDGITPQTSYAFWFRGAQGIVGHGNYVGFKEWTATSQHSAVYLSSSVFDTGGANIDYSPDNIDFHVACENCWRGANFAAGMTGVTGLLKVSIMGTSTEAFTGTPPNDMTFEVVAGADQRIYQGATESLRNVDGQARVNSLRRGISVFEAWGSVTTVTAGSIDVTGSEMTFNTNAVETITDIVNATGVSGLLTVTFRNSDTETKTFTHDSAKLRLAGGVDQVIGANDSITFKQISSTLWQQVG